MFDLGVVWSKVWVWLLDLRGFSVEMYVMSYAYEPPATGTVDISFRVPSGEFAEDVFIDDSPTSLSRRRTKGTGAEPETR